MRSLIILVVILILTIGMGVYLWGSKTYVFPPNTSNPDSSPTQVSVIAENFDTPWAIVFLPDTSMLVTERAGRVRFISSNGKLQPSPVLTLNDIQETGEGGLLGIAAHPSYPQRPFVYLYYTYSDGGKLYNKVVRYEYSDNPTPHLRQSKVIVDKIPSSVNHNGGRIKFGPDGYLYITTGDAENPSQAQDINVLGGKILRVTDEGAPAPGNPFNNLVYSYGHRNPQGVTWDDSGILWETEHGPSGGSFGTGHDEFNKIEAGKNYGWPEILGDQQKAGMEQPVSHSGDDTWAPGGTAFYKYPDNRYSIFLIIRLL